MTPQPKIIAIVVMGVSGSGKSTIAEALARKLGFSEEDGDSFHPASNIAKMSAGIPLTDEDRRPWLRAIAASIDRHAETGQPFVVACSALKRAYRDILVHGRTDVRFVFLKGSYDFIAARMKLRDGHFMPMSLLRNQFETLEPPTDDEHVITVDIDATIDEIVAKIVSRLASEIKG
jgi:gluconokinase